MERGDSYISAASFQFFVAVTILISITRDGEA